MAEDRDDGGLERRLEAWAEAGAIDLRPEVHRAASATLKRDLRPVKPLPSIGVRAGQFLAGFGVCAAALMAMLGKAGFHMMPARQMAGMGILLVGGAVYFAFQLAGQMAPGGRLVASSVLGPLLLSAGVGASMATLFPWRMPQAFAREGWPCALLEVMIAAPAVALFWVGGSAGSTVCVGRAGGRVNGNFGVSRAHGGSGAVHVSRGPAFAGVALRDGGVAGCSWRTAWKSYGRPAAVTSDSRSRKSRPRVS